MRGRGATTWRWRGTEQQEVPRGIITRRGCAGPRPPEELGGRLTSTRLQKEEFAARVLEEREGGGMLYGGYCTEGGQWRPEEVRSYATEVGAA